MKQRAYFSCPQGGQPLVAVYDEHRNRLKVTALHQEEPTEQTQAWMAQLPPTDLYLPDLNYAEVILIGCGVSPSLEFEGI